MPAGFLELAQSLREEGEVGAQVLARLAGLAALGSAERVAAMLRRNQHVTQGAALLTELAPHERVVRAMLDVGALAAFPAFSPATADLRAGDAVLLRGSVRDVFPGEALVMLSAGRVTTGFLIDRAHVIGVERPVPTMFPHMG